MKIGSFKVNGALYSIKIDNQFCEGYLLKYRNHHQDVLVSDTNDGKKYNYDVLYRNILMGIIEMIVVYEMEHRELKTKESHFIPFSTMFTHAMNTLTCSDRGWDGDFSIAGVNYMVIVDNEKAEDDSFYGRCNPNSKIIYLCTQSKGEKLHKDFIGKTLMHEIIHAINYEMGQSDSKYNSEKFVNVLASYLYEVMNTIKIKYPE